MQKETSEFFRDGVTTALDFLHMQGEKNADIGASLIAINHCTDPPPDRTSQLYAESPPKGPS